MPMGDAPAIFKLSMGGLATACEDHQITYLDVQPVELDGAQFLSPPIKPLLMAPDMP